MSPGDILIMASLLASGTLILLSYLIILENPRKNHTRILAYSWTWHCFHASDDT